MFKCDACVKNLGSQRSDVIAVKPPPDVSFSVGFFEENPLPEQALVWYPVFDGDRHEGLRVPTRYSPP
jgi:hypothetical protein